jgi:hypothetical protein
MAGVKIIVRSSADHAKARTHVSTSHCIVYLWIPAFERVKILAAPSVVMAGLDPAIQCRTEFIGFFVDGPVKPGHDNCGFCGRRDFFTCSFAGMTIKRSKLLAASIRHGSEMSDAKSGPDRELINRSLRLRPYYG